MADTGQETLLLLIQRISEMQIEQGKAQARQSIEQHEISKSLAILATKLEPLSNLTSDLTSLRMKVNNNETQLTQHSRSLNTVTVAVDALQKTSDTRSGWEGFGGKFLYAIAGAALPIIIAAVMVYKG